MTAGRESPGGDNPGGVWITCIVRLVSSETPQVIKTRPTLIEERFRVRGSASRDVIMAEFLLPKGSLDPVAIAAAIPKLVAALPMLSARYQAPRPWGLRTEVEVSGEYRFEDSLRIHPPGTSLDWLHLELTRIHGDIEDSKLWSLHYIPGEIPGEIPGGEADCLLFAIHHLIADATSFARVLITLMHLIEGGTMPAPDDRPTHVEERHEVMRAAIEYRSRPRLVPATRVVRFPQRHRVSDPGLLGNVAPDLRVIRNNAREAGASFHEYSLAAMAIASSRWLAEVAGADVAGADVGGRKVVVRFPVNLRPFDNPVQGFGPAVGHADAITEPFGRGIDEVLPQVRESLAAQRDVLRTDGQRRYAVSPLAPMIWAVPAAARPALMSLAGGDEPTIWLSNSGTFTDGVAQRTIRVRSGILRRSPSAPLILMFSACDKLQITGSLPAAVATPEESGRFFNLFAEVLERGA